METFKKLLVNYLDEKIKEAGFLAKNKTRTEDKSKYKAVMNKSNNNQENTNGTKPVLGEDEGYLYVWLDTNTGKFSRTFSKEDVETYLNKKDIQEAQHDKWALIEYKCLNGVEFEF